MMLKVLGMAHEQAVKGLIRDAFRRNPGVTAGRMRMCFIPIFWT